MTSDQPLNRRQSDMKLDELLSLVNDVRRWQDTHLLEYHANIRIEEAQTLIDEHKAIVPRVSANQVKLDRIITILEGEDVISDLDGHVVEHLPGMRAQLEEITRASRNGGLHAKIQLSIFQKALITGGLGLLTAVAALLAEIVRNL